MFEVQNNSSAGHPCTLQPGDDRLAVRAGGTAGCSVSRANPRRIAPWALITLETQDGLRLENTVAKDGVGPTGWGEDSQFDGVRFRLWLVLPHHPAAGGRRGLECDRGVSQRGRRGHRAGPVAPEAEGPTGGGSGGEVAT